MSIAFQYWYLMQGGEGLPAGAIAYKNRVEADGGTTTSLGCVPDEVWAWVAPSYNLETQALLDRANTEGFALPSAANIILISDAIESMKTSGAWAKADRIGFWANDSGSINFGRINAKNPSGDLASIVNGVSFVNKKGIKGDGVSAYVSTAYNPTTDAVNYGIDSASILVYQYEVPTVGQLLVGSNVSIVRIQALNSSIQRLNITGNLDIPANFAQTGLIGLHKKTSTNVDIQINGTLTSATYSANSLLPDFDLTLLAGVSLNFYSNTGISFDFMGGDISSSAISVSTAMNNYYNELQLL